MASDDEDSETIGDGDFDDYEENEIDEDILDAIEAGADDASDGDSVRSYVCAISTNISLSPGSTR